MQHGLVELFFVALLPELGDKLRACLEVFGLLGDVSCDDALQVLCAVFLQYCDECVADGVDLGRGIDTRRGLRRIDARKRVVDRRAECFLVHSLRHVFLRE